MDIDNPLDKHLKANRYPASINDPIVFVADTLDVARLIAESVFKEAATPEVAVLVFDRLAPLMQRHASLVKAVQLHAENSVE